MKPCFKNLFKSKAAKRISAAAISAAVIASTLCIAACGGDKPFVIPENKLPTEDKYALTKYDYQNLDEVKATLRSDTMQVTKRNLERPSPEILTDEFSLTYNVSTKTLRPEYSIVQSTSTIKSSSITFVNSAYPYPGGSGGGDGGSTKFVNAYAPQAEAAGVSKEDYFYYYKYMLLTQGQHLAVEAQRRSAEGTLTQDWLKKHPAADLQYGAVKGENNAVEKEIILDPIYRAYHATGLYLPAGEVVKVKVQGLAPGERISVFVGLQDSIGWAGDVTNAGRSEINEITGGEKVEYFNSGSANFFKQGDILTACGSFFKYNKGSSLPFMQSQWKRQNNRAPWVAAQFVFNADGEYNIGTHFGGIMHINPMNCYSQVKTTFTGAVETPHYILGVTTPDYFEEHLKSAPGVVGVIDTENGQLIGPTGEMDTTKNIRGIKKDEVDKLAMLWHSFFAVNESFTGGTYNRGNLVKFDQHVPAGAAVALGGYVYACPTGWYSDATNYRRLLTHGTWGTLHEIGHNHGGSYGSIWGFGGNQEGEVRNNALNLLCYIMFCDLGTTVRSGTTPEHGEYANPYRVLNETIALKGKLADHNNANYFQALGMYANIMHSFGAEKYYELLYTYKTNSSYCSNKRADFAYRCSTIYGMNFLRYFNDFYSAKITEDMFTAEQLAEIKALPNYEPVSCFYAGGIDGVKTAGDYLVSYGENITFDLKNQTVCTLDEDDKKGFEIISVDKPEHGKIKELGDGKYEYSFNSKYTGVFDEFSFDVKLADGVVHKLTITLRISYNGSRLSTYEGVNVKAGEWDALENEMSAVTPTVVSTKYSYIKTYNSKVKEAKVLEYYWKAPVSGEVTLSAQSDDTLRLYFGENFNEMQMLLELNQYNTGYSDDKSAKITVEKDKFYAVKLLNYNGGGPGSAVVAYKTGDGDYTAIPDSQVYHPSFPQGKTPQEYIYEPQFIISKKDNVKLTLTGTDKSEWKMEKAPENIVGGRYYEETMVDEETGEETVLRTDKWTYLIDGLTSTNMHTTYGGSDKMITPENPHEFIVDTAKVQMFNYFAVTTRNNVNSYITDFELQISDTADGEWKTITTGNRDNYSGTTITLKFPEVSGRYLRLLVKGTTGGKFSVLAEIDAGIKSTTQKVVPSTTSKFFATKGWVYSSTVEGEPAGYLMTYKKNQKLVIKFRGESLAIYAAAGNGYGSAQVIVDGKKAGVFDLNSSIPESRKLAFNIESLSNKEHTVEIITKSTGKVMLNVFGIPYSADLVNASNIYLERGLTIALVIFIVLFAALAAFAVTLLLLPEFRKKVFGNKLVQKLDNRERKPKKEKTAASDNTQSKKTEPEKPVKPVKADVKPAAGKTATVTKTDAAKPAPAVKKTDAAKPAPTVRKTESAKTAAADKKSDKDKKTKK